MKRSFCERCDISYETVQRLEHLNCAVHRRNVFLFGQRELEVECTVCRDDKAPSDFPTKSPTAACTHKATACKQCLQKHVEAQLNYKGEIKITCYACPQVLDNHEVRRAATTAVFDRYEKLLVRRAVAELPDFRWCKNATCGSGQEHVGGDGAPVMTCHACKHRMCFKHDVPWHTGKSCEAYDELIRESESASLAYLDRRTKRCPRCTRPIEKNGGCDHMTCQRGGGGCGHEFCWRCLAEYAPILRYGNHRHRNTCQYYAAYGGEDDEEDEAEDEDADGRAGNPIVID